MVFCKKLFVIFCSLFIFQKLNAQFTTNWVLTSNTTGTKTGVNAGDIQISDAVVGSSFNNSNLGYSNNGIKLQPTSGNNWPNSVTNGWQLDFPISPITSSNIDATLLGLTFEVRASGSSGSNLVSLSIQKDGVGAFVPFGTVQTIIGGGTSIITFPSFSQKLYSGHTYLVRMNLYANSSNITASRSLTIRNLVFNGTVAPVGTQPTVITQTVTNTTKYTAEVNGSITAGTYTIIKSGVVWGVSANPTIDLSTLTTNGPINTGAINGANGGSISGLSAGTTYNVRAYAESETGDVIYGTNLQFTTLPPSVPVLTTNPISSITSIKALSGGVIIDSGGVGITEKGICWSTSANPTILNSITNDGSGNSNYTSIIKILKPSTNYCVRAYAKNSIGVGYGNEHCFTTLAPEPVIITTTANTQNSIPFGAVIVGSMSAVKSYNLQASSLLPLTGTITINAPAEFQVSENPITGFSSSITFNYTGGSVTNKVIYVKYIPTKFGNASGTITHSGGGATLNNIDNVNVTGTGIQNPSELSNTGTDFWVGYGFQALMTGSNNQEMVLYISSKQDATVTVEIGKPGDANYYIQNYNITANNAIMSLPLPKTGAQDSRLNSSGVLPRGIHVYSNGVPFSLWSHIYASSSSGATLVLPTNTWGSNYSVMTVGGVTNSGVPHSFFFVQAAEDNTVIDINPTADITANASGTTVFYPANVPFSVTLNKGDVFNALGKLISSNNGVDLTGTTVISRDCNKKIAVFTGNGRVQLFVGNCNPTNGGSDNFIQQMFPKQAWGTKYLTSPFRGMEAGIYKVLVGDPGTVVKVNGITLNNIIQNSYLIETDTLLNIESDKPVMVAQFCVTNSCNNTGISTSPNTGPLGDPEMIILSPVQQAIDDVTVYSTNNSNIQSNFINVIIPNNGVASFMLDGVNVSSSFRAHTADIKYSYAVFENLAGNTSHRLQSNVPFNAIAYGFSTNSSNESYGYNAGTHLKPLDQFISVKNPYPNTTADSVIPTCLNNDFTYSVILPYKPISMNWDFFNNPIQLPNSNAVVVNNPLPVDSFNLNGVIMFKYELPTTYNFSGVGSFPVNITMNATNADGCTGTQTITFTLKVVEPPTPKATLSYWPCLPTILNFEDSSFDKSGYSIVGREWTFLGFNPTITSTVANPTITYSDAGNYDIKLRTINSIGCFRDSTFTVTLYNGPKVDSLISSKINSCINNSITFTAFATTSLGTIVKYYWDFGDGTKDTTTTNIVNHVFSTANTTGYTVTVTVESSAGCVSGVKSITQKVFTLKADFTFTTPQCLNSVVNFTDASLGTNVAAPFSVNWLWTLNGNANTSNLQNASYTYTVANNYDIQQKVFLLNNGNIICEDSITKALTITPVLTLTSIQTNNNVMNYTCINKPILFTVNSSSILSNTKWYWNWSDGRRDTTNTNTISRAFNNSGLITVNVFAKVNDGCASNTLSFEMNVFNLVAANSFTTPQCVNNNILFTDNSTGTVTSAIVDTRYLWSFGDNANSTSTNQNPTFSYNLANSYSVKMRVSLAAGLVEFCADSITKPITINDVLAKPSISLNNAQTTTTSLTFNWNSISNSTGYQVSTNNSMWTTPSSGNNGLEHVLNNLLPNSTHTVCVKPLGSCLGDTACYTATTNETTKEVFIPNTFTPNGDGKNDKIVVCSNSISQVRLSVYNQYGEKMYEGNSSNSVANCFELWDGRAFGKDQPVGVYAYISTITLKDGKVVHRKGLINLIR